MHWWLGLPHPQSQAFALTAYTAVSLWAVALVLQTLFPEVTGRLWGARRPPRPKGSARWEWVAKEAEGNG